MSILIRGMKMPIEKSRIIQIHPDGTVRRLDGSIFNSRFEAVPVPSHGRLIDADAIALKDGPYEYDEWCEWALTQYQDAPTILPAEEGE